MFWGKMRTIDLFKYQKGTPRVGGIIYEYKKLLDFTLKIISFLKCTLLLCIDMVLLILF